VSALEALKAARVAGVELRVDGEALILEAAAPPPAEVIDLLSRNKSALVALLRPGEDGSSAEDWRGFFDERVAIAECDAGLARQEAEARSFGACVIGWLNRDPIRSTEDRCCWCGRGERGDTMLFRFGADRGGDAWLHSACRWPWQEHRQAQAIASLRALGIAAPSDFPNDFAKNGAP
jgi:hypothetical protein